MEDNLNSMENLLKSKRYKRYELYDKKMEARSRGEKEYNTGELCKHGHTSNRSTITNRCLECDRLHGKDIVRERKNASLKAKYGITSKQYDEMMLSQQGKCVLCLVEFNLQKPITKQYPVVDHCHATGEVRSLLCGYCNSMLGFAKDNPETLRAAIKYLELFKE
jgi:hypothetical protein